MAKKKVTHSPGFDKWYKRYQRGGCTKAQLRRLVELEALPKSMRRSLESLTRWTDGRDGKHRA